jgi:hypothetical protein
MGLSTLHYQPSTPFPCGIGWLQARSHKPGPGGSIPPPATNHASRARVEEQRPFKPQGQGANPWRCTSLVGVAETQGIGFVNRTMRVKTPPPAPFQKVDG